jgi:hypothetical protein
MVLLLVLGLSGPGGDGLATLCVGVHRPDQGLLSVWQDLLIPDVFAQPIAQHQSPRDEKSNLVHFVIKCPSTEL